MSRHLPWYYCRISVKGEEERGGRGHAYRFILLDPSIPSTDRLTNYEQRKALGLPTFTSDFRQGERDTLIVLDLFYEMTETWQTSEPIFVNYTHEQRKMSKIRDWGINKLAMGTHDTGIRVTIKWYDHYLYNKALINIPSRRKGFRGGIWERSEHKKSPDLKLKNLSPGRQCDGVLSA
jgi:hypothetical protein